MSEKGYWIIRTYKAGGVGEKTKSWIPYGKQRNKNSGKSDEKKKAQNETSTLRRAARIINENFNHGDILLGLDYSDEGMSRVEKRAERLLAENEEMSREDALFRSADHEMGLFLRRLRESIRKAGGTLKYFGVTADRDGDTGESVRLHHHIIVSGLSREFAEAIGKVKEKWSLGGVSAEHIWQDADQLRLAGYLLRQVRDMPNAKAYTPSRNLVLPPPSDRISHTDAELRVPKGCTLISRAGFDGGKSDQYIRYFLPHKGKEWINE